jgi:hypothetical protein
MVPFSIIGHIFFRPDSSHSLALGVVGALLTPPTRYCLLASAAETVFRFVGVIPLFHVEVIILGIQVL